MELINCKGTIAQKSYCFVLPFKGLETGSTTSKCQPKTNALTNIILPAIKFGDMHNSAVVFSDKLKYSPVAKALLIM